MRRRLRCSRRSSRSEAHVGQRGDHVRHLHARRELRVRDLGFDVPVAPDLVVAREDGGRLVLCLPNGAAVPAACRMAVRMGRATLRLSLVADDVDAPSRPRPDPRVALGIIAAAALHLVILGLVAHGRAPEGAQDEAALETMQRMVASAEERAVAELAAAKERSEQEAVTVRSSSNALPKPAAVAGTQVKERGAAGNPGSTKVAQVARRSRPSGSSRCSRAPKAVAVQAARRSPPRPDPPRWATSSARPSMTPKAPADSVSAEPHRTAFVDDEASSTNFA